MGAVALVPTVKWLWFVFGLATFTPVVIALVRVFRQTVIGTSPARHPPLEGGIPVCSNSLHSGSAPLWRGTRFQ